MTASSMGGDVMDGGWGGYGPGGGDGGCGGFGGFEFVVGSGRTRRWCVCRIKVGVDFVLFLLLLLGVYATRARAEDVGGGTRSRPGDLPRAGGGRGSLTTSPCVDGSSVSADWVRVTTSRPHASSGTTLDV